MPASKGPNHLSNNHSSSNLSTTLTEAEVYIPPLSSWTKKQAKNVNIDFVLTQKQQQSNAKELSARQPPPSTTTKKPIPTTEEAIKKSKRQRITLNYDSTFKYTFYSQTRDKVIQSNSLLQLQDYDETASLLLLGTGTTESESSSNSIASLMEEGLFWLDVCASTDAEMELISKIFNIHPLTMEDIQESDLETREKIEMYENYIFITTKCLHYLPNRSHSHCPSLIDSTSLFLVIFEDFILSFHRKQTKSIKKVLRRIQAVKGLFQMTTEWIMYALLDAVTDEYAPRVAEIEQEVDSIEDLVLTNFTYTAIIELDPFMRRIADCKKAVTKLNRLLAPKSEMIKDLVRRSTERMKSYTLLYMRDVLDHALQMLQQLENYNESLERSHVNYLAQINIELSHASNRLNEVMKKMTACTIVVTPLNLIAGIWGMNVKVPGFDARESYFPFYSILALMCFAAILTAYISRRFSWI